MGEDSQPLTIESDLRQANRGILVIMAGVVVVTAVLAGLMAGASAAAAVGLGGILAWLNYRWLDASTRAMMVDPTAATTPLLAMRYVLRYALIGAVLYGVWLTGLLPVGWIIAGLGSFAVAVVIRGLKSIFTGSQ